MVPMGKIVFALGGARSGKSRYGQAVASAVGARVTFIATGQACDEEMARRIARHRDERPAGWRTIEEPCRIAGAVKRAGADSDAVLVDCLTLFLSNWLLMPGISTDDASQAALAELDAMLEAARACPALTVIVSNEVGTGVVPDSDLGRAFRDLSGWANQRVAATADEVVFMVAGIPMRVKG